MSPKLSHTPSAAAAATLAAVAALLLLCGAARAQGSPREVNITAGALNIVFTPPRGCEAAPEERLAEALAAGAPIRYGCITPGERTSVFVMVAESVGTRKGFAGFERGLKAAAREDDPGVKFTRRVIDLNGSKWVALRYTQGAGAAAVVNDVYMIDWAGHLVIFNFLAPASKFAASRAALEASAKSIALSISVIAPAPTPGAPDGGRQN